MQIKLATRFDRTVTEMGMKNSQVIDLTTLNDNSMKERQQQNDALSSNHKSKSYKDLTQSVKNLNEGL